MKPLSAFFEPRSIAIIGASRQAGKLGHDVVRNLIHFGYQGAIYPVNPRADEILGLPVYATIADLPKPLDLAVIAVPASYVLEALEACGKHGMAAAIVVSGGFREIGEEGAVLERKIQKIAEQYHIALLGPNCIGIIDTHTPVNTTFVTGTPPQGNIAFISQSGAIVASVIHWAEKAKVGFSRMVSLGNQAGVTETVMIADLIHDPHTKVVTAYLEGIVDGHAFIETASSISPALPMIVLKAGRSSGGAKAAASHTGALAGTESAYKAAFRRAGILRANTLEEMLDWSRAFAMQPLPHGNRVAILTNAGGQGILAVDALEMAGLQLAPLMPETKNYLRENLHPAASVNNPIDILAGSKPPTYALCLEALLKDETVDAIVVITAPQDWFDPLTLTEVITEASNSPIGCRIPFLTSIMALEADSPALEHLREQGVPNFDFPERIGKVLAAMWQRQQYLSSLKDKTTIFPDKLVDRVCAESASKSNDKWLKAEQVNQLLSAYGITLPQESIAQTVADAAEIANQIGFPLAMKLQVKDLSHKTDMGGVMLNIDSLEVLKDAFLTLQNRVPENAEFEGILLQEMIFGQIEAIIGIVRDPIFGAMLMVGSGGTQVELLRDVAFELAPLSRKQAEAMLERISLGQLLKGYRGQAVADIEALIDTMQLLSQIALDFPQISEIEINPLLIRDEGKGAIVVDARVAMAKNEPENA